MQTVNNLLTMYVGAASQHALRTTFVPREEAHQLRQRDRVLLVATCRQRCHFPTFSPPTTYGRAQGVGSRGTPTRPQRHGQLGDPSFPLSWRPPNPRTSTPCSPPRPSYGANSTNYKLRYHNKWDKPSLLLKSLGVALRTHGSQKTLVNTIQQVTHQQLLTSLSTNTIQKAILVSQTAKNTGAHLQQPNSEAYEADDRCFHVSLARRLMLPHPAANHSANISPTCPNVSADKRICACPIDDYQLHCTTCKSGGGVDQRHSALARWPSGPHHYTHWHKGAH